MKILQSLKIANMSDVIFAKNSLKNIFKNFNTPYKTYLIFSLMELATNIIKHSKVGKIYFLKNKDELSLCSLDYGKGIKDIEWSMQNGSTNKKNSLGLGLFQMNRDSHYHVEIFSLTKSDLHGTIVLVKPRRLTHDILSLSLLYPTELVSGDLFAKKGKYLLLSDASGHGKKANQTANIIKTYFYKTPFSCIDIDYFFENLHTLLHTQKVRGAAISIFEVSKNSLQVCGIGNLSFWYKEKKNFTYTLQKEGIVGEYLSHPQKREFHLKEQSIFIATTDGVDVNLMNRLLREVPHKISSMMLALASMHFASVKYDDKTILILRRSSYE